MNFPEMDSNPIYFFKRDGSASNPFVKIVENITIRDGRAFLKETPEKYERVIVKHGSIIYSEVDKKELIKDSTDYFVNYREGILYFHKDAVNKMLNISYSGIGMLLYPASRIYIDSESGKIKQTLQELANTGAEALSGYNSRLEELIKVLNDGIANGDKQLTITKAQGELAKLQGDIAEQQGLAVKGFALQFEQTKADTILATEATKKAIFDAEVATRLASDSTLLANNSASFSKAQGDYAKLQGDFAKAKGLETELITQKANSDLIILNKTVLNAELATAEASKQASYAKTEADKVNGKILLTEQATALANEKALLAQEKSALANASSLKADNSALYAKEQGDFAKLETTSSISVREQMVLDLVVLNNTILSTKAVTDSAQAQANYAKLQGDTAKTNAETANQSAIIASQKAKLAQDMANLAELSTTNANTEATYAKAQGDYAKEQGLIASEVIASGNVYSINGRTGAVLLTSEDVNTYTKEEINSNMAKMKKSLKEMQMMTSMRGVL